MPALVAPFVVTVTPVAWSFDPAPFTSKPSAYPFPDVVTEPPVIETCPPVSMFTPDALSPVVAIVVPFVRLTEPPPVALTPFEPRPLVATEPPFSVTMPPVSACAPLALAPDVAIVVPFEVEMLDPAPLDWSPSALSPDVATDPPVIVVTPPLLVTTPVALVPFVTIAVLVRVSVPPLGAPGADPLLAPNAASPSTGLTFPSVVTVIPLAVREPFEPPTFKPTPPGPVVKIVVPPDSETVAPPAGPPG